jgi:hypothetical protein
MRCQLSLHRFASHIAQDVIIITQQLQNKSANLHQNTPHLQAHVRLFATFSAEDSAQSACYYNVAGFSGKASIEKNSASVSW